MDKITKAEAKKRYESGKIIYLNASKMRIHNNMWHQPMKASKQILDGETFEAMINSYSYYNCSSETGKTVHFYKD